jgi:predicted metal-dependent hydrolase
MFISIGDKMIKFDVIRSKRKTLSLQVNDKCEVIVRAPMNYPDSKIDKFINDHILWIDKAIKRQKEKADNFRDISDKDIEVFKKSLREYLPHKIDYYSELMGVKPNGYKVTSARKRFGSCSSKNYLCFSYQLMLYPEDAIDYVIVHELAHIKYHNHSKDFYDFIKSVMPDYKEREKILR